MNDPGRASDSRTDDPAVAERAPEEPRPVLGTAPAALGFSRRRLLLMGLGVTSVALMGGGAGLWALRGSAPPVQGLSVLSDHEVRTLRAVVSAILPAAGVFASDVSTLELERQFDGFVATLAPELARDIKLALGWIEFGPLIYGGTLTTFSKLSPEARETHWAEWEQCDDALRRRAALAFRKFCQSRFYDFEPTWKSIGYPGPFPEGM